MTYYPAYQITYTLKRIRDLGARTSHSQREVATEVIVLLGIMKEIPRWKVWRWATLGAKISFTLHKYHRTCCPNLQNL